MQANHILRNEVWQSHGDGYDRRTDGMNYHMAPESYRKGTYRAPMAPISNNQFWSTKQEGFEWMMCAVRRDSAWGRMEMVTL